MSSPDDAYEDYLPLDKPGKIPGDSKLYITRVDIAMYGGRHAVYCQARKGNMVCSYKCRKDKFMEQWRRLTDKGKKPQNYKSHKCTWVRSDSADIANFFTPIASSVRPETQPSEVLTMLLSRTVGMENLPLHFAESEPLWEALRYVFLKGQENLGAAFSECLPETLTRQAKEESYGIGRF